MKKSSLLIIFLVIAGYASAQNKLTNDQQAVQHTVVNFFDTFSGKAPADMKKYATADAVFYESGYIDNVDSLLNSALNALKDPNHTRTNTFEFISTTVQQDIAWVTYRLTSNVARTGRKSTVLWIETVILTRERNQWKIKVLHSTTLKRS